jgi:hypothetical protein
MTEDQKFPWESHTCYEPPPLHRARPATLPPLIIVTIIVVGLVIASLLLWTAPN